MVTSSLNELSTDHLGNRVEVDASVQIFKDDVNGFSATSNICFMPSITKKTCPGRLFNSFLFQGPTAEHESLSLTIWPRTSPAGTLFLPTNILHTFKKK
jgi:hypothetical protein